VTCKTHGRLGPRDHVSNAPHDLLWLPVQHRITYKLCLPSLCILFTIISGAMLPIAGRQCHRATASLSHRGRLRSASSQRYEQPRTRLKFGERCFAFAGPAAWNSLPSPVQELTDTTACKHQLKTVLLLFQRCYVVQLYYLVLISF